MTAKFRIEQGTRSQKCHERSNKIGYEKHGYASKNDVTENVVGEKTWGNVSKSHNERNAKKEQSREKIS